MPRTRFDRSYSHPDAEATPWDAADRVLREAELYWLSTVRADGRPHVTPLIAIWLGESAYFTTGPEEQKARNLQHSPRVTLTTGTNVWAEGLDVAVEGTAARVSDRDMLRRVAKAYVDKYGEEWAFDVDKLATADPGVPQAVDMFVITPTKVLAFAKGPHAQTAYDFG